MSSGPPDGVSRNRTVLAIAAVAIVAAEPFVFWDSFAGDAQVHLVFMESASQGRFFEFNPGERVSGETSPAYMMLGATLFRLIPAASVPVALKILGLLGWYGLCLLVWRAALHLFAADRAPGARSWAALAAFVAATVPGSVYNANVGMENGLFAAAIWGWIVLAARWRWFEPGKVPYRREAVLASILGVSCWLRPEGFLVMLLVAVVRARRAREPARSLLLGLLLPGAIGLLGFAFEWSFTGDLIPTSVLSRRILAMPHTFALGPLSIDPSFAKRLIVYLPLTALYFVGLRPDRAGAPRSSVSLPLDLLLLAFFVLFTLAGAPHLARYLIFLIPILTIGAVGGAMRLWRAEKTGPRLLVAIAALILIASNVVEMSRRRDLYAPGLLTTAAAAPARRREFTDDLIRRLGEPIKRPIAIGIESVQLRYEVDDRIVIRSLDGRVDRLLLGLVGPGTVDHAAYLRARQVDFLIGTPSYARDESVWSLSALRRMLPGQVLRHDNLSFRRLDAISAYAVTQM